LTTSPILNDPEAPVPFDCFKLWCLREGQRHIH
jgi:hypothetical protein